MTPTATSSRTTTAPCTALRHTALRRTALRGPPPPPPRRTHMALTGEAKEELSHLEVTRPSARKAEAAAMLRLAGGLHLVAGNIVVAAELDPAAVARRRHATVVVRCHHRGDLGR